MAVAFEQRRVLKLAQHHYGFIGAPEIPVFQPEQEIGDGLIVPLIGELAVNGQNRLIRLGKPGQSIEKTVQITILRRVALELGFQPAKGGAGVVEPAGIKLGQSFAKKRPLGQDWSDVAMLPNPEKIGCRI